MDSRLSNYLFQRIIEAATQGAGFAPSNIVPASKVMLFPRVCPTIFKLAPGVYHSSLGAHYATDQDLGGWVAQVETDELALIWPPKRYRKREVTSGKNLQPKALDGKEGFRMFRQNSTSTVEQAFGLLEGWPVWLSHSPRKPVRLHCADGAMPLVRPWVEARGGRFKSTR